ncbi:MAG: allene oxide cyclase family protein [Actinomycetota bacterium]
MRKTLSVAAAAVVVVLIAGYVAHAGTTHRRAAVVVHVIEHATTDLVVDTGPSGDSSGDLLTFANDLFDETNANKVGRDQGDCIRINATEGSWECRWTTFLKGGAIMVEGPFYDSHDSVLAITGGRGKYKDARGSMELKALLDGTGYDFIFNLNA